MHRDRDLFRRTKWKLAKQSAVLLACMVAFGCSSQMGTAVIAELLALEDGATDDDGSSAPSALPPYPATTQIAERGRYVVPDRKTALISFVPGIFAVARKSADFTCDTLRLTKDGNETDTDAIQTRTVAVHLQSGAATFSLPWKDISGRSTIEVSLPYAQINAASGSLFHVDVGNEIVRNHLRPARGANHYCDWRHRDRARGVLQVIDAADNDGLDLMRSRAVGAGGAGPAR